MNANYFCIVYPGGTGGNHIANMMRLCPQVYSEIDNYQEKIIEFYENETDRLASESIIDARDVKAHYFSSHSVQRLPVSDKTVVIEGHFQQYETSIIEKTFPFDSTHFWMIVKFPDWESMPGKRIRAMNFWPQDPSNYKLPFRFIVTDKIIVDKNNGVLLDSEIIFTEHGSEYLRTELRKYDLILPNSADILHKHWIGWMKYIENSPPLFDPN